LPQRLPFAVTLNRSASRTTCSCALWRIGRISSAVVIRQNPIWQSGDRASPSPLGMQSAPAFHEPVVGSRLNLPTPYPLQVLFQRLSSHQPQMLRIPAILPGDLTIDILHPWPGILPGADDGNYAFIFFDGQSNAPGDIFRPQRLLCGSADPCPIFVWHQGRAWCWISLNAWVTNSRVSLGGSSLMAFSLFLFWGPVVLSEHFYLFSSMSFS
jgi:hypothetical protein